MKAQKSVSFIKKCLLAVCLLFAGTSISVSVLHADPITEGDVLTLDKAVEIGLQNHPSIDAQKYQVKVGEAKIGQSRASYYPQITISTGYSRISPVDTETSSQTSQSGMTPGTSIPTGLNGQENSYNQYTSNASLNQLLFDFGKTWGQVNVQKLNTEAARFQLENTKDQVIFSVKQAYYMLLGFQHALIVAAEAVENFKNHLNVAASYYRAGIKPKFDVTKAEVDYTNAELYYIKVENSVRVARVNLNNAMGLFHKTVPAYTLVDDQNIEPYDVTLDNAVETAYAKRADLQAVQLQKEASKESIAVSQKGYFPTFSGVASYTYVGSDYPLDGGWYAGAYLVFPLFSGFMTKNQVEEAKANYEVVNANERALKQQIYLELEQAYIALREAFQSRRKTELSVRQANENRDLATQRYKAGIGTPEELSDALVAYSNARLADITALYDYKIARDRIERSIGGVN
jgi:outer membrane protein TolC